MRAKPKGPAVPTALPVTIASTSSTCSGSSSRATCSPQVVWVSPAALTVRHVRSPARRMRPRCEQQPLILQRRAPGGADSVRARVDAGDRSQGEARAEGATQALEVDVQRRAAPRLPQDLRAQHEPGMGGHDLEARAVVAEIGEHHQRLDPRNARHRRPCRRGGPTAALQDEAGGGTTRTRRSACWMSSSETLPSGNDVTPPRPRVPRMTTRASTSAAAARIARATPPCPLAIRGSATNPPSVVRARPRPRSPAPSAR